ncbi:unnamed protein product [Schistosoma margrebowiei]|uniref:Uncharacterized protein n=1 Tax=Schistosoma margrebowiei TaxID=48269 RepID=A0A183NB48_9TREM|nr:unnamed protein product [Schistosoma margrebowiei]
MRTSRQFYCTELKLRELPQPSSKCTTICKQMSSQDTQYSLTGSISNSLLWERKKQLPTEELIIICSTDGDENEGRTPLLSDQSRTVQLISAHHSRRPRNSPPSDDFQKIGVNINHGPSLIANNDVTHPPGSNLCTWL